MATSGEETDQDILAPDYSPNPSTSDFLAKIIDKVTFGLVTVAVTTPALTKRWGGAPWGRGAGKIGFLFFKKSSYLLMIQAFSLRVYLYLPDLMDKLNVQKKLMNKQ